MTSISTLGNLLLATALLMGGSAQAAIPAAVPVAAASSSSAAAAAVPAAPPSLASAVAMAPIPQLSAHVTDQAGMLAPGQRAALESVLSDYERRTGSQLAILLVSSTAPDPIEHYSIRVADAWKVGRKGVDDGVLIVIAKNNPAELRRMRIEAGRGVQGTLTDAQSKRILQDTMAPHFRQNDYYGGLAAGVAAITSLLDQEHFAAPKSNATAAKAAAVADTAGGSWPFLLLAVIIMAVLLRSRGGGPGLRHSRGDWGNAGGVLLGALIGNALGRAGRSGGFNGGDFSGGGGSDGGGFSGGGGGFDGGGASGNW